MNDAGAVSLPRATRPVTLSRRYPEAPLVGVAAAVFDAAGRVLLVQRGRPPGAGTWGLPGGLLDLGEKLADGAAREVREECGIDVAIGAVIHNWIPTTLIQAVLGKSNPFSVLLATALGIPMYADIFGTIPIAEALFAKGVGLGTVLSFMMAVTALSLPSMIMLSKVIKPRLLFFFIGVVSVGILLVGYLFNGFQFLLTR